MTAVVHCLCTFFYKSTSFLFCLLFLIFLPLVYIDTDQSLLHLTISDTSPSGSRCGRYLSRSLTQIWQLFVISFFELVHKDLVIGDFCLTWLLLPLVWDVF